MAPASESRRRPSLRHAGRQEVLLPSAQDPQASARGAVAALQQPLAAAEVAVAHNDFARVMRLLRPPMEDFGALLGNGRLFELWGLCGAEGLGQTEPVAALRQALRAYQDEHDVAGMARCHNVLAQLAHGRGELADAEREFGYAHALFSRRGSTEDRVRSLTHQALVAMARGESRRGMELADAAVGLCRERTATAELEAEARLVRAEGCAAHGEPGRGVRDLLWAERLLGAGDTVRGACPVVFARAESLLALGYPRRALSVLRPAVAHSSIGDGAAPLRPSAAAHALRLEGHSSLDDNPQRAWELLLEAQRRFVLLRQPYFRVGCEIALLRAMQRSGAAGVRARVDALNALKLQRWPRLASAFSVAKSELDRSYVHVPGAVRTPWIDSVAHHTGKVVIDEQEAADSSAHVDASAGFFGRVQLAWGRWRGVRSTY